MSSRLYEYNILPYQIDLLFEDYDISTYEFIDSFIYLCDVYDYGYMKKKEFICVKIKKRDEASIHCKNMDFEKFIQLCVSKS